MNSYSPEIREAALRRILPPNSEPISSVSRDMGISDKTLRIWKDKAAADDSLDLNSFDESTIFSSEEKFDIVVATASMNETQLGEFARSKGIFVEQINSWREICKKSNDNFGKEWRKFNSLLKEKDNQIKILQENINKKDKALAELTAEIILRKKCSAIWGEKKVE